MKDDDLNLDDLSLEDEFGGETRDDKSDKAVEEIRASEKAKALDEVIQRKLKRAAHLIDAGDFDEARERLDAVEKDEEDRTGDCEIAEVYYLRIFLDYKVRTADELVEHLANSEEKIEENRNYRLFKSCARDDEAQNMQSLIKRVDEKVSDRKNKAEEERKRKLREEEERRLAEEERQRKIREEQERQRKAREEEERKRKEEEERQRKAREEQERKRKEKEEHQRKLAAEAKAREEAEKKAWAEKIQKSLKRVSAFIEMGKFDEAENALKPIEEDIVKTHGSNDIADTFYYRIYLEYKKKNEKDLVKHLFNNNIDITKNNNYIMAKSLADGEMSQKVLAIVNGIKNAKKEAEKKAEEQRKAKEEAQRAEEERREQERRREAARLEQQRESRIKILKISGIVIAVLAALGILLLAILGPIYIKDTAWPGIFSFVFFFNLVMIPLNIAAMYNLWDAEYMFYRIISILGFIIAIVLMFIKAYAVWSWGIALALLICSIPSLVISKIEDEGFKSFLIALILSIVLFMITWVAMGVYGWSTYF